jgi:hypothetical protein
VLADSCLMARLLSSSLTLPRIAFLFDIPGCLARCCLYWALSPFTLHHGLRFLHAAFSCAPSCSDIRKAEAQGLRYYYMFKIVSLALSLLVFMLTSDWTSPEILNLFLSTTISLYCIWYLPSSSPLFASCNALPAGRSIEDPL